MVREKLTHLDELYNSVKHLDGVGKRNEYDEAGLLALVTQLASLTHQPVDNQKVQGVPLKKLARKSLNIAHKEPMPQKGLKTLKSHQLALTQPLT